MNRPATAPEGAQKPLCAPSACQQTRAIQPDKYRRNTPPAKDLAICPISPILPIDSNYHETIHPHSKIESGLPPSLPASPAVPASMAPLTTRAPPENKLAPCASSARHLRSAPLAPETQPGKRQ